MKYVPFIFTSKDNLILQCRAWLSQKNPTKGTVYLLHDLGEHSARYAHIAEEFSDQGYHFVGFDLRGHGLSEGRRGHSSKFTHLMNDIEQLICQSIRHFDFSREHRILYGQGFGGNLALNYGLRRKPNLSGMIITSPIFSTPMTKSKIRYAWLQFMANTFPKLRYRHPIKSSDLSRDLILNKAYQDDVYNQNKISTRLALDIHRSGQYALANAEKLDIPLLLMHGTSDKITSHSVSKSIAEKVGNMAELVLWENARHELHNEIDNHLIIKKMIAWLEKEIN